MPKGREDEYFDWPTTDARKSSSESSMQDGGYKINYKFDYSTAKSRAKKKAQQLKDAAKRKIQDAKDATKQRKVTKKAMADKKANQKRFKTTKTPTESRTRSKGGSYEGTHTGQISKRKDAKVITKYSPLVKEIKDELIALSARQKIGRRKMRFRL